jgi:transposase
MTSSARSRRPRAPRPGFLHKPAGRFTDRVQAVGPDHFGVVSIDCAKARSRYQLTDFYGRIYLPPATLPHTRGDFEAVIARVRQALAAHDLRDLVVAIERTGEYHRPVQRAFRQAGWEVRLVHPFATKQYRQPADLGNKTDDTDLAAIFRVAVNGFGLLEAPWPDDYQQLQLLRRHRRDLVRKASQLQCQIREVLHAAMPGYAELFGHFWEHVLALPLARRTGSAAAVRLAGLDGLKAIADSTGLRYRSQTLPEVLAWANNAPPSHPQADCLGRILAALDNDRLEKSRQIQALEGTLARFVVGTPYVLLLAIPGINVVSTADLAGELGPIELYANANAITGRAALMPSRYQSDAVDCAGPLRRSGNRRLRAALVQIADNLAKKNQHFQARATLWARAGKDLRWVRVKIAKSFSRIAFAMVAGRQLFAHPCCQSRHYILDKLVEFHLAHGTSATLLKEDLDAAVKHLPRRACSDEAKPLAERLEELGRSRRGPQPLAKILPLVLAKLGLHQLESTEEEQDSGEPEGPAIR